MLRRHEVNCSVQLNCVQLKIQNLHIDSGYHWHQSLMASVGRDFAGVDVARCEPRLELLSPNGVENTSAKSSVELWLYRLSIRRRTVSQALVLQAQSEIARYREQRRANP